MTLGTREWRVLQTLEYLGGRADFGDLLEILRLEAEIDRCMRVLPVHATRNWLALELAADDRLNGRLLAELAVTELTARLRYLWGIPQLLLHRMQWNSHQLIVALANLEDQKLVTELVEPKVVSRLSRLLPHSHVSRRSMTFRLTHAGWDLMEAKHAAE